MLGNCLHLPGSRASDCQMSHWILKGAVMADCSLLEGRLLLNDRMQDGPASSAMVKKNTAMATTPGAQGTSSWKRAGRRFGGGTFGNGMDFPKSINRRSWASRYTAAHGTSPVPAVRGRLSLHTAPLSPPGEVMPLPAMRISSDRSLEVQESWPRQSP